MGILQARILKWVAMPSSRESSQPKDKPRCPALQGDYSLSEPPRKPKNTRVGSLSLLKGSSQPRNRTGVSCIAGGFVTSWATREAPKWTYVLLVKLFKKIRDTKGTFHAKMGSIKDRNSRDLTEADNIKRWQEYTEELYKKDLHDPDNHDGVITHLEPDILECEVK